MAEQELPKLTTRVRFPSPAPLKSTIGSPFLRRVVSETRFQHEASGAMAQTPCKLLAWMPDYTGMTIGTT